MRLFLNIRESSGCLTIDPDGEDFHSIAEAEAEAGAAARDIMADALRNNQPMVIERSVEITDERGTVVLSVAFESAIAW
jgi:hypothetical protein